MLTVIQTTVPIFAVIALGYGLTSAQVFKPSDIRVLGRLVLLVLLPALIFHAVATRDFSEVLNGSYLLIYVGSGFVVQAVMYALIAAQGMGPGRQAFAAFGGSCPNSAFITYPLLLPIIPDHAATVLALNLVAENFFLMPASLVLLELSRPKEGRSALRMAGELTLAILRRPYIIGLLLGTAVALSGIELPLVVDRFATMLGGATAAVALLFIGGTMVGMPMRGNVWLAAQTAMAKLVLHPAFAAAMLFLGLPLALGLAPLGPEMQIALVMSCAAPMANIFPMLAANYGFEDIASMALVSATGMAFVTLSVVLLLMT